MLFKERLQFIRGGWSLTAGRIFLTIFSKIWRDTPGAEDCYPLATQVLGKVAQDTASATRRAHRHARSVWPRGPTGSFLPL